jgi:hypothetical protein
MIGAPIIGAVLFVGAIGCATASSIVLSDTVEGINRVFPEQESPTGWHFGKLLWMQYKYPMLCPGGNRNKKYSRLAIAAPVSGLCWCLVDDSTEGVWVLKTDFLG